MLILFIFVSVAVLRFVSTQHVSAVLPWPKDLPGLELKMLVS